jgi:hypothetical protein
MSTTAEQVLKAAGNRCRCMSVHCGTAHLNGLYCESPDQVIVVPVDETKTTTQACEPGVKLVAMCRPCVKRRAARIKKAVRDHELIERTRSEGLF